VKLLKPELTPRINELLAHYQKYYDERPPIIFIGMYKVNDNDYQIYMAVFSSYDFDISNKYGRIPSGFFDFKRYKVFVFGDLPSDLFAMTINKETFCYFNKPKIISHKVSTIPYPPEVSMETTTWIANFTNGNISLLSKIMGGW